MYYNKDLENFANLFRSIQLKHDVPLALARYRKIKELKNIFYHCCEQPTKFIIPFHLGRSSKFNIGLCGFHKDNPNPIKYKIEKEFQNKNIDSIDKSGLEAFL